MPEHDSINAAAEKGLHRESKQAAAKYMNDAQALSEPSKVLIGPGKHNPRLKPWAMFEIAVLLMLRCL